MPTLLGMAPTEAPSADRAQLFISYRREDSAGYARALHEALAQAYGHERVFIDVDDIAAGQRFAEVIAQALGSSAVLLVLIGPRWAGPRDGAAARIHDAHDFVRREVEVGLAQGLHVVPVLLDGTPLPDPATLPTSLHPLLQRHALVLVSQGFKANLAQLLAALQPHLGIADPAAPAPAQPRTPGPPPRRRRVLAGAAAGLGLVAASIGGGWWARRGPQAADFAGTWEAEVTYPWPNAVYTERISLRLDDDPGATLAGHASFLRVPRVIGEVQLDAQGLRFSTRSTSESGADRWEDLHRYRVHSLADDQLAVEMQTESQGVARTPLHFTARRLPGAGR